MTGEAAAGDAVESVRLEKWKNGRTPADGPPDETVELDPGELRLAMQAGGATEAAIRAALEGGV